MKFLRKLLKKQNEMGYLLSHGMKVGQNSHIYSDSTIDHIYPHEEAEGKEAEMLELYQILQYNSLFDEENRSQVFFPTH